MDQQLNYTGILTQIMRAEEQFQPLNGPAIVSVCDAQTGQFLLVAVGWQKQRHIDSILFHARLLDGLVVIETDNTEEGLKDSLIEAGIAAEHLLQGSDYQRPALARAAV